MQILADRQPYLTIKSLKLEEVKHIFVGIMTMLFEGVLRLALVSRRILVLLAIHTLHARLVRMHSRAAAAQEHANDPSDGQQTIQDTRLSNAQMDTRQQRRASARRYCFSESQFRLAAAAVFVVAFIIWLLLLFANYIYSFVKL